MSCLMFDIQPGQLIMEEDGYLALAGLGATLRRGCWLATGDWADVVLAAGVPRLEAATATTTAARHGLNISNMAHT